MKQSLLALAIVGGVDAISYMIVTPSLIFYVLQCGGSVEQYGLVLSVFSLASCITKPFLGWWIDSNGNKFRTPYFVTILIAMLGSSLYFLASAYKETPHIAIPLIFAGRFLGGVGAANQAIGFAYLAAVVPHEQQTTTNSLLSMVRILGMAAGPGFNVILQHVDGQMHFGSKTIELDALNSVGLFLVGINLLAIAAFFFLLQEPPERKHKKPPVRFSVSGETEPSMLRLFKACLHIDILLPIFTLLVVNSAFQLIETGFAPAASDAMGWGPVETSAVLGGTSVLIFASMLLVMYLSSKKVSDDVIMSIGCICWIVGGTMMYLLWRRDAQGWHFVVPVIICVSGFPFIAPSNRSKFTKGVDSIPLLESRQGSMQALLSTFASIAGFVTPGFVAAFVLRRPEEVEASSDKRELSPVALYVAILPLLVLIAIIVSNKVQKKRRLEKEESLGDTNEGTRLLAGKHHEGRSFSDVAVQQTFDLRTEMNRRASVQVAGTGIPLMMVASEKARRDSMYDQLQDMDWSAFDDEEN